MPYDDNGQWYDYETEPWRRYNEEDDPRGNSENWEDGEYRRPPNPNFFYRTISLPEGTILAKQSEKAYLISMPGNRSDVWIPIMRNARTPPILHGDARNLTAIDLPEWLYKKKIRQFMAIEEPNTESFQEFDEFG
jgi:hypothetical protein